MVFDNYWRRYLIAAPLVAAVIVIADMVIVGNLPEMHKEGRGIENATVAILVYALVGMWLAVPDRVVGPSWHVAAAIALAAMRELDFDKAFLADGVFRAKLYTQDNPLLHKLIGGVVLVLVFWVIGRLLRRSAPGWLRALWRGLGWAFAVLGALASVIVAKSIDGAGRKMRDLFGVELTPDVATGLSVFEEVLELVFALLIVVAVVTWAQWLKRGGDGAPSAQAAES